MTIDGYPIPRCEECGSDEDVAECPACDMWFCGEHRANFVTETGCPYCALVDEPVEVGHAQAA